MWIQSHYKFHQIRPHARFTSSWCYIFHPFTQCAIRTTSLMVVRALLHPFNNRKMSKGRGGTLTVVFVRLDVCSAHHIICNALIKGEFVDQKLPSTLLAYVFWSVATPTAKVLTFSPISVLHSQLKASHIASI